MNTIQPIRGQESLYKLYNIDTSKEVLSAACFYTPIVLKLSIIVQM